MIKKFAVMLLAAVSISAQAGKIITETFKSERLGTEVKYNVYLPNGFERDNATYPIVYLLHGFTDDYTAWKERGQMQTVADELIESGEAREMVIVMPNAGGPDVMNTWNGYLNMPGWPYEDFFFDEFLPAIEKKYRIVGDKEHRAIMGLSMGGGGSTIYAQRHPDMFSSCYAMSPWLEFSGKNQYQENSKPYYLQESMRDCSALTFLEGLDATTAEKLRTVKWFFDCGDDDFLFDLSVRIHQLMRKKRIKDELRVRNGQHNWEYWHQAIRIALPFASRNFSK
ncbi:MAG: alpha/beta fold hydrolase [Bacteroidales bacterium]|nr:alpha/beta fold hydrolase [Candidatus Physcousia equi]